MNGKFVSLALSVSLGLGVGFGYGLVSSGKPFVLEATDTPIGSFVLRGNVALVEPIPQPKQHDFWLNIA